MTADYNPVSVENAIKVCADQIARGVKICDERYRAFLEADHVYDVAFAGAYLDANGPAHAKKYEAELATMAERKARDTADAAYKYAERRARAFQDELRALQSVGASVRSAYNVAGVGA